MFSTVYDKTDKYKAVREVLSILLKNSLLKIIMMEEVHKEAFNHN